MTPTLRDLVQTLERRPDVTGALVLGRDGLLVESAGLALPDAEHLAALLPGMASAADMVGSATGRGGLVSALLECERALLAVTVLTRDVLLVVALADDAEPSHLVAELRRARTQLAALV